MTLNPEAIKVKMGGSGEYAMIYITLREYMAQPQMQGLYATI